MTPDPGRTNRQKTLLPEREGGFSILEALVASTILAIVFLALSSLSLGMINGNEISKKYLEAAVMAQSLVESLRYTGFDLDEDGNIDTAMDSTHPLSNPNTGNDLLTDPATLFASPDHAYTYSGGVESTPVLASPSLTTDGNLRRAWVVRDNIPADGIKTLTVIIGWKENNADYYIAINTAVQGE